jgi:hypothetical protein
LGFDSVSIDGLMGLFKIHCSIKLASPKGIANFHKSNTICCVEYKALLHAFFVFIARLSLFGATISNMSKVIPMRRMGKNCQVNGIC